MSDEPKEGANRGNAGKGRPKGAKNKVTAELKGMILEALDASGGVEYLVRQAEDKPVAFMALLGRVLPMTVGTDPDNPLKVIHEIRLVAPSGGG